jgi:prepilin-type N-terminal cleavage/methylation domain-containing protein
MVSSIRRRRSCRAGFTLIELMIVLAIIAMLAAIVCKRSTSDALARASEVQRSVSTIRQGNKAS